MKDLKNLVEQYKSINVLYVEDEKDVREQMLKIFDMIFSSVDVATDGLEALEMYRVTVSYTHLTLPTKA